MTDSAESGDNESEISSNEELDVLKKQLGEAQAKVEVNLAGWQRCQADFINYKRRCEQETSELTQFANASLILALLPVMDDFERAFTAAQSGKDSTDAAWVEGMRLILKKFKSTLEMQGVTEINTKDEPFDPRMHEAIKESNGKEGYIVQEVQKGYKLRDKVIRPAKVVVGTGESSSDQE